MADKVIVGTRLSELDPRPLAEVSIQAWKPNNHYIAGAPCISPIDGSLCTAKADFASGASFNVSNWNVLAFGNATYATKFTPTSQTGTYTAAAWDAVLADATSGALAVTLATPSSVGFAVRVKKVDSSANAVTVTPASGLIDGAASFVIAISFQAMEFTWNGSNWYVF